MTKRATMMRNAPTVDVQLPAMRTTSITPTAPAVSALQQRVKDMTGDSVTLHINGRDILFTMRVIPAEAVERSTMVYTGNERDQELLTEDSLADILPTFRTAGQQFPGIGTEINGVIVIADGSRRRAASILAGRSYRILVGELTEDEMKWLTKLGNDYTPPSAYERGKRFARLLKHNFNGNLSALAESEGVSRRVLSRYIKTATLPIEIIKAFAVPNDLSMKGGEVLAALLFDFREGLIDVAVDIAARRKNGEVIEADDVFNELKAVAERKPKKTATTREFGKGVKAVYKDGKMVVKLEGAPENLINEIERLLEKHERAQIASTIDLNLDALQSVLNLIKDAAKIRGVEVSKNEEKSLILDTRRIMNETENHHERINRIGLLISTKFAK